MRVSLNFAIVNLVSHKENDDILCLRIEGANLNLDADPFVCLCYNLPSESSRQNLNDEDIFYRTCNYVTLVKHELGDQCHFFICADMNAKIGNRDDFVQLDMPTYIDTSR